MSYASSVRLVGVRLFRHMRANAIAYLALFAALGGTSAWAATKITSKDIAKNAVLTKHIKNNAVTGAKVAGGAVTGSKIANGSVGGAKIAQEQPIVVDDLANGWVTWGVGYTVSYWKDAVGVVHLTGGVKDGATSTDDDYFPLFKLPPGYRPAQVQYQPVVSTTGGQLPIVPAFVEVCAEPVCSAADAGNVAIYGGDNGYVGLDGVSFRAE